MKAKQKIVAIAMAILLAGGTVTTVSVLPETSISMEVSAATTGTLYRITAPDWLALRASDSTKGRLLQRIPKDAIVSVTSYNSKKTWGKTTYNGSTGWICLQAYAKSYKNTGNLYKIARCDWLSLRASASTKGKLLQKIPNNTMIEVTSYNGGKTWGRVKFNGSSGWICLQKYVDRISANPTPTPTPTPNTNQTTKLPLNKAVSMPANGQFGTGYTLANINGKWYTNENPFYKQWKGQCTWYAWGRFYEVNGIKLNSQGHAKTWTDETNSKVKYVAGVNNIQNNCIAVNTTKGNGCGHVMFIEYVERDKNGNPKYVYLTQANYDANHIYNRNIDGKLEKWSWSEFTSSSRSGRNPSGYIVVK